MGRESLLTNTNTLVVKVHLTCSTCESPASRDVLINITIFLLCRSVLQFISQGNHTCHASVQCVCFELSVCIFWLLINLQFVLILSV